MAIFGNKDKSGNISVNFAFCDGIPTISPGLAVNVTLNNQDRSADIKARMSKLEPFRIAYSQICAASVVTETEIKESNKSVVGRAALGGLMLGPLGAIVGGMGGIGTKKKSSPKSYVVLNYRPQANPEEIKAVSFEVVGATIGLSKFMAAAKESFNIETQQTGGYL